MGTSEQHATAVGALGPALDDADEIWLYLSGGGLRSALGSLGVFYFLRYEAKVWSKVMRIASVSGGSVENAALVTSGGEDHLRATFHRLSHYGSLRHYRRSAVHLLAWFTIVVAAAWGLWRAFDDVIVDLPTPAVISLGVVEGAIMLLVVLAAVQYVITSYMRDRLRWILSAERVGSAHAMLHLFATTDMASGEPTHVLMVSSDARRLTDVVVMHDNTAQTNRFDYYDADEVGIDALTAAQASSVWPFACRAVTVRPNGQLVRDIDEFGIRMQKTADPPLDAPSMETFSLMDGGMSGTLASRLDAALERNGDRDVMSQLEFPKGQSSSGRVLRIVVDGGRYPRRSRIASLSNVPGVSALTSTRRSVTVLLANGLTVARRLVDRDRDLWYVGVTGHGRHFGGAVPLDAPRGDRVQPPRTVQVGVDRGWTRRNARRRPEKLKPLALELDDAGTVTDDVEKSLTLLERLRLEADGVGYLRPWRRAGACAAAGVAATYIEANGADTRYEDLVDTVMAFQRAIRRYGELDDILEQVNGPARATYRWEQLDRLLPHPPEQHNAIPVSHQGKSRPGQCGHTIDNFVDAHVAGFAVLECDLVLVDAAGERALVAIHADWQGKVRKGFRRVKAADLSVDRLAEWLGRSRDDMVTLDDLLGHRDLADATWNFETKDRKSMEELVDQLTRAVEDGHGATAKSGVTLRASGLDTGGGSKRSDVDDRPHRARPLLDRVILSGGWSRRTIREARRELPNVPTAIDWWEAIRLFFGVRVSHAALVQLPAWRGVAFLTSRVARRAAAARIQVQWFAVSDPKRAMRLARAERIPVGLITEVAEAVELWLRPGQTRTGPP